MAEEWLIFVDTNVFLDFYRFPGESAKRQMAALERHKNKLIISDQVRMEFFKNRQKVILSAFEGIKKPQKGQFPQIVSDSEPVRLLRKAERETDRRYGQLKERIENLLSKPLNYDDVLKSFNRIFKTNSPYNLKRPDKVRFEIRNRARKRFSLGYPPRKSGDTSIGDAFNWEWIIECANKSSPNQHILCVSRDGDFGAEFGGKSYLNDWLHREFKERVSKRRKIELTTKLSVALKRLDEVVSEADENEEIEVLSVPRAFSYEEILSYTRRGPAARILFPDERIEKLLESNALLAHLGEFQDDDD